VPVHTDATLQPLWTVGFRPFFLLGALYGPFILLFWLAVFAGQSLSLPQSFGHLISWHQHEMIFGYAMAIIAGFLLTAVPSWVGGAEIKGRALILLVLAWLLGRLVIWLPVPVNDWIKLVCDQLLLLLLFCFFAPVILRSSNRKFVALLLLLVGFLSGNSFFHIGAANSDAGLLQLGMEVSVYSLMIFYSLVGGILTTVFTGNVLRQSGFRGELKLLPWLEYACLFSVLALAIADILALPDGWVNLTAATALLFHAIRCWRWRPWRVYRYPLIVVLHLSYAWLLVAFLLKLLAGLDYLSNPASWVHAFTIGVLGMKQLGLISRVSLRHTGRPLLPSRLMLLAFTCMFSAALVRVLTSLYGFSHSGLLWSALLWSAAFILFAWVNAPLLLRPSLDKEAQKALITENQSGFWLLEKGQSGRK
jgi:uncharacterized protein involved in response to NO